MPAQTYEAFLRALKKGDVAPVYYLYGSEDILKDEGTRAVLDRVLDPGLRDFNYDLRSAQQLEPDDVVTLCTTLPMMAERRVVVIRDVEAWKRKTKAKGAVVKYLERPVPETVLVLVQGANEESEDKELAKHAVTVPCEPLAPDRALKWLAARAAPLGVSFAEGGAEHLLRSVGNDLGTLFAELQKLAALPDPTGLDARRIGELVGVHHGETIYDWRDAVLNGDTARATALLGPVLEQAGVSGVKLVTLLGQTLIGVGIARAHYDRKLRGRALEDAVFKSLLKVRPFGLGEWKAEAHAWSTWAERWGQRRLGGALQATLETDQALKSTTISDDRGLLTDLTMRLTVRKEKAA
ncbi:MAG TPA: DNA polymerase III subunit delta [Gemmatimonadales bacterium]|nr:DNA polymerase III subunit delta [Gemmatimonadales bacterium]